MAYHFDYTYITCSWEWITGKEYDDAVKVYIAISKPIRVPIDGKIRCMVCADLMPNEFIQAGPCKSWLRMLIHVLQL